MPRAIAKTLGSPAYDGRMASDIGKTIGKNLKALRQEKGLTQRQVAERMRVESMQISRWERGTKPQADQLEALAKALETTTDFLLGRKGNGGDNVDEPEHPTAEEIRQWPAVQLLIPMMAGEEPTDHELEEVVKIAVFHRGSREGDARLAAGMRDVIRGMRSAMTPEQERASREATERYRDPNVPKRKR